MFSASPAVSAVKPLYEVADVVLAAFFDFDAAAAFLRVSLVWAPYFFVNRTIRPSVSSSFCLPV
jgi:hypothetical protein